LAGWTGYPHISPPTLTFVYLGDVLTKKRNCLIDSSNKAVLLIKSWMGHEEAESWGMEMEEKAKDVAEDAASVSDVELRHGLCQSRDKWGRETRRFETKADSAAQPGGPGGESFAQSPSVFAAIHIRFGLAREQQTSQIQLSMTVADVGQQKYLQTKTPSDTRHLQTQATPSATT
jgi:hypothetical protein